MSSPDSPWIPCSERLPELGAEVLIARHGTYSVWIGRREEVGTVSLHGEDPPDPEPWVWVVDRGYHRLDPWEFTHWQPFPDPPPTP